MRNDLVKQALAAGLPEEIAQKLADHAMRDEPDVWDVIAQRAYQGQIREAREVADLCKHTGYSTSVAAMFVGAGYSRRQAQQAMRNHQAAGRSYDLGVSLIGRRIH